MPTFWTNIVEASNSDSISKRCLWKNAPVMPTVPTGLASANPKLYASENKLCTVNVLPKSTVTGFDNISGGYNATANQVFNTHYGKPCHTYQDKYRSSPKIHQEVGQRNCHRNIFRRVQELLHFSHCNWCTVTKQAATNEKPCQL